MPFSNGNAQWVFAATALLSGIISGQMLAIGIANWAARGLPEVSWTLRFQLENKLFTKTMATLFNRANGGHHRLAVSCAGSCVHLYGRLRFFYGPRSCDHHGIQRANQ
jgi:hypothetical protein